MSESITPEQITPEQIDRLAELSMLRLDGIATGEAAHRLNAVLEHIRKLSAVDVSGVLPMAHAHDEPLRLDADEPGPMLDRATFQAMARHWDEPFVRVPKVLGD